MMAFVWVGNHPGVDLTNTVVAVGSEDLVDLLPDWSAVVRWADEAGLAVPHPAEDDPDRQDAAHRTVRRIREALRAVLDGDAGHDDLDRVLATVPIALRTADGPPWVGPTPSASAVDRVTAAVAVAAAEATGLPADRVRRCANHRCVLHFHDTTRGGGRRWCDMATCGNRAKQAAHATRRRVEGS
ncbi:MAG TPA: CGNR zinc finger domain-containing protein [Euzebya sp.]|nr:CGNR zinc finger domain-containing protein [Euzebya sp.]